MEHNMNTSQAEREALANLLQQSSPDAPTLCAGWTARDLVVHLVIREYRPDAVSYTHLTLPTSDLV